MEGLGVSRSCLSPVVERILQCPRCDGPLDRSSDAYVCGGCGHRYVTRQHVARILPEDGGDEGFYDAPDPQRYGRTELPAAFLAQVRDFLRPCPDDGVVVEIGSGGGALDGIHPAYVATDYSLFALLQYSRAPCLQADAQHLPFADSSIDAVITYATLEHVPDPAAALAEIARCLKPGGRAFVFPAWYVRPWAAKGLHVKRFKDLSWADRLVKLTIPVRNSRGWWLAKVLPARVRRELALRVGRRRLAFPSFKLEPNLETFVASDSDAFTSMDAHAAATFFISRGYSDLVRPTALRRLLYGNEPVLVRKP